MYNTNFEVKYYSIQDELVLKLKDIGDKIGDKDIDDEEYNYNIDDVLDICDKLYRDELMSVFYADDLMDDKIDNGMKYVLEKMLENNDFKLMADEVKEHLKRHTLMEEHEKYLETVIILSLFSKDSFYLFHKCICQQLTLGTIESDLLVPLKEYFMQIKF
jgi:hypothetical protein